MKWIIILIRVSMSKIRQISPNIRLKIDEIVEELFRNADKKSRKKIFVMMVGFSKSGKHTLINKHPVLSSFFRIDTDRIHDLLNSRFDFLQDDMTINGRAYWDRQNGTTTLDDAISAVKAQYPKP